MAMLQLKDLCSKTTQCPLARDPTCQDQGQCCVVGKLKECLHRHFNHSDFRPGQLSSVLGATHGRDVFVRMATGAGKSLCIFLAPLAVSETVMGIVISPLIGLMEQHVRQSFTSVNLLVPVMWL